MDKPHFKTAAHGEATRTDLLFSTSRYHSTRLLFTEEDITAKQVFSRAHCVCRWVESRPYSPLAENLPTCPWI